MQERKEKEEERKERQEGRFVLRWGDWHMGVAWQIVAGIHYCPHINYMTLGPVRT